MFDKEDKEYLEALLSERFENRLSALERESNHIRRNMLTGERAQSIFRDTTLRVNAWTRLSVAVIAALAVIGNGISNVLVDHTESRAMARYETVTDRKLAGYESRLQQINQQLALEMRAVIVERNSHLEALIVKAGNNDPN
jgi:hypothetical protein